MSSDSFSCEARQNKNECLIRVRDGNESKRIINGSSQGQQLNDNNSLKWKKKKKNNNNNNN
ncbi:uncharacterized protein Dmoj_GI26930, isoform B [Drosophila mojavensis]|uniref:Uncharacterized protein, isoform B n=1 Tax=Drosophila mojavensis TaxID=7230 RepID=A0A0Q9WVT6_DROMO|nr:uncharacterized protein Dmoj_GI26930, isoform B [Drosophila mojavensis]